jgi:hypothetical protein
MQINLKQILSSVNNSINLRKLKGDSNRNLAKDLREFDKDCQEKFNSEPKLTKEAYIAQTKLAELSDSLNSHSKSANNLEKLESKFNDFYNYIYESLPESTLKDTLNSRMFDCQDKVDSNYEFLKILDSYVEGSEKNIKDITYDFSVVKDYFDLNQELIYKDPQEVFIKMLSIHFNKNLDQITNEYQIKYDFSKTTKKLDELFEAYGSQQDKETEEFKIQCLRNIIKPTTNILTGTKHENKLKLTNEHISEPKFRFILNPQSFIKNIHRTFLEENNNLEKSLKFERENFMKTNVISALAQLNSALAQLNSALDTDKQYIKTLDAQLRSNVSKKFSHTHPKTKEKIFELVSLMKKFQHSKHIKDIQYLINDTDEKNLFIYNEKINQLLKNLVDGKLLDKKSATHFIDILQSKNLKINLDSLSKTEHKDEKALTENIIKILSKYNLKQVDNMNFINLIDQSKEYLRISAGNQNNATSNDKHSIEVVELELTDPLTVPTKNSTFRKKINKSTESQLNLNIETNHSNNNNVDEIQQSKVLYETFSPQIGSTKKTDLTISILEDALLPNSNLKQNIKPDDEVITENDIIKQIQKLEPELINDISLEKNFFQSVIKDIAIKAEIETFQQNQQDFESSLKDTDNKLDQSVNINKEAHIDSDLENFYVSTSHPDSNYKTLHEISNLNAKTLEADLIILNESPESGLDKQKPNLEFLEAIAGTDTRDLSETLENSSSSTLAPTPAKSNFETLHQLAQQNSQIHNKEQPKESHEDKTSTTKDTPAPAPSNRFSRLAQIAKEQEKENPNLNSGL